MDGVYHECLIFVKMLSCPDDNRIAGFKRVQEKVRKDVERAFGALKKVEKYLEIC